MVSQLFIPSGQNHLRIFVRFFPLDSCGPVATSLPANESAKVQNPEKFPQPVQRFREAPPHRAPPAAQQHAPFRSGCSPAARSSRSALLEPAQFGQATRHIVHENHRILKRADPVGGHPGPEKLPSQQRRQPSHFHRHSADNASACAASVPGRATNRDWRDPRWLGLDQTAIFRFWRRCQQGSRQRSRHPAIVRKRKWNALMPSSVPAKRRLSTSKGSASILDLPANAAGWSTFRELARPVSPVAARAIDRLRSLAPQPQPPATFTVLQFQLDHFRIRCFS